LRIILTLYLFEVLLTADEPRVECLSDSIRVSFDTENEFEGHVYVKGHYSRSECRVDATLLNNVSLTIPFTACDMRRQRSNNPKGVHIYVPVIITFHPMFITKIDKSYNVQCFYHEVDKTVTTQLDVSFGRNQEKKIIVMVGDATPPTSEGLQTEVITVQMPLPVCKYQVLSGGPNGEPVKFASVGQIVYHQWSCTAPDGSNEGFYCATIHSCVVEEDGGREVQLLDENGCAVDKYLLDNLQYTSDLTGGQLSQVFKFADQSSLFFHCQIRLSIKDGKCKRSSDYCSKTPKAKRSVEKVKNDDLSNVDVFSQSMTVFDIDDPISKFSYGF
uniref:ZP domain-containing protein n=1 Tax=Syphacia muris TaxID=451379 RepID=A0A0N5A7K5_9BILA